MRCTLGRTGRCVLILGWRRRGPRKAVSVFWDGDWVEPAAAEWVATQQAPDRKSSPADRSMRCDGDGCVFGAGWHEAASRASAQCVQRRRDPAAIKRKQGQKDASHLATSALASRGASVVLAHARSALAC